VNDWHLARFLKRVEEDDDSCWVWTGYIDEKGRGSLHIEGKYVYAHRASYEHYRGPIPDGHHIHHICGNKICVNPDHLRSVTVQEHRMAHR